MDISKIVFEEHEPYEAGFGAYFEREIRPFLAERATELRAIGRYKRWGSWVVRLAWGALIGIFFYVTFYLPDQLGIEDISDIDVELKVGAVVCALGVAALSNWTGRRQRRREATLRLALLQKSGAFLKTRPTLRKPTTTSGQLKRMGVIPRNCGVDVNDEFEITPNDSTATIWTIDLSPRKSLGDVMDFSDLLKMPLLHRLASGSEWFPGHDGVAYPASAIVVRIEQSGSSTPETLRITRKGLGGSEYGDAEFRSLFEVHFENERQADILLPPARQKRMVQLHKAFAWIMDPLSPLPAGGVRSVYFDGCWFFLVPFDHTETLVNAVDAADPVAGIRRAMFGLHMMERVADFVVDGVGGFADLEERNKQAAINYARRRAAAMSEVYEHPDGGIEFLHETFETKDEAERAREAYTQKMARIRRGGL